MTRVLICGGRDFADRDRISRALMRFKPANVALDASEHIFILGGAPGADRLAEEWADVFGIRKRVFPADWYPNGRSGGLDRSAGPRRNQQMLDDGRPELVISFPRASGQFGSGTLDMMRRARSASIPIETP